MSSLCPAASKSVAASEPSSGSASAGDIVLADRLQEASEASERPSASFVADTLALGIAVMLIMTIVQRGLGFVRGIWFCRLMDESDVGTWSMSYDFIVMMTPIALMGIPGSLARYVEQFRLQGHLRPMVGRLALVTGTLGICLVSLMMVAPSWFGWLIFLQPGHTSLVISVALGVASIIFFNFVYELVASLRQVRVASMMHFVQSVTFSVVGVLYLTLGGSVRGVIGVFITATLVATLPGWWALRRGWSGLTKSDEPFSASGMWRRLLPYAGALWMMNVLVNLFDISDRYMILHLLPGGDEVTRAAVGQYHTGRIIPMLLASLGTMVGGVLLPYLAAEWEQGRRREVVQKLKMVLMGISLLFTVGAAVTMLIAPWLFGTFLQGRYSAGLQLMPMAFVFCTWSAIVTIGQGYLWVSEKGKWVGIYLSIGLIINVILNYFLLPIWGLPGAAFSTMVANGFVVTGMWIATVRNGLGWDWNMLSLTLLPATLLAGPQVSLSCAVLLAIASPELLKTMADFLRNRGAVATAAS
jgi:polysaccharide transporter, PST family